ncbi:hypothetical protein [uncultured Tateyamaria sp.]|uniref:hypothetical protein n=1 Tax=Tateyamaria sp. 1078 TaxID=3417464 RepID=UPI00260EF0C8|nr:hypothetical protein [uncultured Tateyamaria sp.]
MKGSFSLMKFLEAHPALWLVLSLVLAALVLAPVLMRMRRARAALRKRLETLAQKKTDLLAAQGTDEYYMYIDAYLRALDPKCELPDRAALDALLHTAHLSDTIFHYNSVDWFAAHGTEADFQNLVSGLQSLGLRDMVDPVFAASDYHQMIDTQMDDDTDDDALFVLSDIIAEEYEERGGAARVREAVHKALQPRMDVILAA